MKLLRKICFCILSVCMLAACSSTEESTDPAGPVSENALVVYFSATGNTQNAAQMIVDNTGADLFEIEPVDPYTSQDLSWNDPQSRVSIEHENEDTRHVELVSTQPENWDSYDTVYLGYPIWWGQAAWPVESFVEANDFSGKTVIPFCTSSSSGLGQSAAGLEELAQSGDWQEGMRFSSGATQEDIDSWIASLS